MDRVTSQDCRYGPVTESCGGFSMRTAMFRREEGPLLPSPHWRKAWCQFCMRGCVRVCVQPTCSPYHRPLVSPVMRTHLHQAGPSKNEPKCSTAALSRPLNRGFPLLAHLRRAFPVVRETATRHWSVTQSTEPARHWSEGSGKRAGRGLSDEIPQLACSVS